LKLKPEKGDPVMKKSSGFLLRLMVIVAFFLCSQSIVFATGKQESGSSAARGSDFLTKYSGTTLRIVSWATAYSDVAQRINPEFEKITGIKVNWEMYGAWQAREKFGIELAAHSQDLDLFWYQNTASSLWLYKGGHLEDIRKYINDPARTPRDWDWKDFYPGIVKSLEIFPDMPLSMPTGAVSDMLYYRKDLLEKKGIAVPKTYAELEQAAAKLAEDTNGDGKIDVYGWVCRGKGGQATYPLANPLYAFGGAWFTKDGQPVPSVRRTDPWPSRLVTHPSHAVISYTAFASSVKVRDRLMKVSTR
jgi:multiple sugar transport system substrate-binding protein